MHHRKFFLILLFLLKVLGNSSDENELEESDVMAKKCSDILLGVNLQDFDYEFCLNYAFPDIGSEILTGIHLLDEMIETEGIQEATAALEDIISHTLRFAEKAAAKTLLHSVLTIKHLKEAHDIKYGEGTFVTPAISADLDELKDLLQHIDNHPSNSETIIKEIIEVLEDLKYMLTKIMGKKSAILNDFHTSIDSLKKLCTKSTMKNPLLAPHLDWLDNVLNPNNEFEYSNGDPFYTMEHYISTKLRRPVEIKTHSNKGSKQNKEVPVEYMKRDNGRINIVYTVAESDFAALGASIYSIISNTQSNRLQYYTFYIIVDSTHLLTLGQWLIPQLLDKYGVKETGIVEELPKKFPGVYQHLKNSKAIPQEKTTSKLSKGRKPSESDDTEKKIVSAAGIAKKLPFELKFYPLDRDLINFNYTVRGVNRSHENRSIEFARIFIPTMLPHLQKYFFIGANVIVRTDIEVIWRSSLLHRYVVSYPPDLPPLQANKNMKEKPSVMPVFYPGYNKDNWNAWKADSALMESYGERLKDRTNADGAVIAGFETCQSTYQSALDPQNSAVTDLITLSTCLFDTDFVVVDAEAWRQANITSILLDWIHQNTLTSCYNGAVKAAIQAVFYQSYHNLAIKKEIHWNFVPELGYSTIENVLENATVLIWSGPLTPWYQNNYQGSAATIWYSYALSNPPYTNYQIEKRVNRYDDSFLTRHRIRQSRAILQKSSMHLSNKNYASKIVLMCLFAVVLMFLLSLLYHMENGPHRYTLEDSKAIYLNIMGTKVVKTIRYVEIE